MHFRALFKKKGQPEEKITNSRSLVYLKGFIFCGFSGLEQIFWGWGERGGGLEHGRFLEITLTYSRLLSLITQKLNNLSH